MAAGHTFLILFREAYPINLINHIRNVGEVATIYCATSNPVQVIVAKVGNGRSVLGIVDGLSSRAIENEDDKQNRTKLLTFPLRRPTPASPAAAEADVCG
jgi:adenosine/AMP kinase